MKTENKPKLILRSYVLKVSASSRAEAGPVWSDFRAQALDLEVALAGGEAWTLTWVSRLGVPMLLPLQRYEWLCQCQVIHPDLDRQPTLPRQSVHPGPL